MMDRRQFLFNGAATAVAAATQRKKQAPKRPNVLFLLADEWRAPSFGYAGDAQAPTKAIDRLASQSVRFRNAVSGLPVCCPYRASLMTGQYPLTHGVFINDVPLEPKGTTLGEAFRSAGYQTGYIGKWHLYGSPDGHYGRRLSYIPPEKRFGFDYWKACECTHNYSHSLYYEGDDPTPRYWPGYDAFAQTDDAAAFISKHAHDAQPFFLVMSYGPPHFPYGTAPEPYKSQWANTTIELRPNVPEDRQAQAREEMRGYYAHMAALDSCVDKLMTLLDHLGIADDTVVVFTSDHGDMVLSQGLPYKLYPWEESVRVPLLVRYPRVTGRQGRDTDVLSNAPDLMPTLTSLCSIPVPQGVQGTDLSPTVRGEHQPSDPQSAFLNLPAPFSQARHYGIPAYRGVRTRRYTYVRTTSGPWLLYDNLKDPFQKRNLCDKPDQQELQQELEGELKQWLLRLNDEFLPGDVYLEKAHLTHYREAQEPIGHITSPWGDWRT